MTNFEWFSSKFEDLLESYRSLKGLVTNDAELSKINDIEDYAVDAFNKLEMDAWLKDRTIDELNDIIEREDFNV